MVHTVRSRRRHVAPISGIEQLTLRNMKDVDVNKPIGYDMLMFDPNSKMWTFVTPLISDTTLTHLIEEDGELIFSGAPN